MYNLLIIYFWENLKSKYEEIYTIVNHLHLTPLISEYMISVLGIPY